MAEEWYRRPEWTPQARADFEARLGRARRTSRAQYLRIKGSALHDAGLVAEARTLWRRVVDDAEALSIERAAALEALADSYVGRDPDAAERHYRVLLADFPTLNGTSGTAEIALAELLADRGGPEDVDEAADLLESFLARGTSRFPDVMRRWNRVTLRLGELVGDEETVQRMRRLLEG